MKIMRVLTLIFFISAVCFVAGCYKCTGSSACHTIQDPDQCENTMSCDRDSFPTDLQRAMLCSGVSCIWYDDDGNPDTPTVCGGYTSGVSPYYGWPCCKTTQCSFDS